MFYLHSLAGQAPCHIISYFPLHITPPECLLQVLIQLITHSVYRVWSIVPLVQDFPFQLLHGWDAHLIVESDGTILMDYEPRCFSYQYLISYPLELRVGGLRRLDFFYEGRLYLQGVKHRFSPWGNYIKL